MKIYPAIDIYENKVVRLYQGDFGKSTTISDDPLRVAKALAEAGSRYIHIVDLEGAKKGKPVNVHVIPKMKDLFQCLHYGGGLRSPADVKMALSMGADKVMIASLIWDEGPDEALTAFKSRIIPALDVKKGLIALSGWLKTASIRPDEAILHLKTLGYETVLVTAVERDGTKRGPDLELYEKLLKVAPEMNIIAAGGIGTAKDVWALAKLNIFGAVIGKALYDGSINLKTLLEEAANA